MSFTKNLVILFALVAFLWLLRVLLIGYYPDFSVYYFGSELFLQGKNPYIQSSHLFSGYSYPPNVFLFFLPILIIPYFLASYLWILINILLLLISIFLLSKIFSIPVFSKINLFKLFPNLH